MKRVIKFATDGKICIDDDIAEPIRDNDELYVRTDDSGERRYDAAMSEAAPCTSSLATNTSENIKASTQSTDARS